MHETKTGSRLIYAQNENAQGACPGLYQQLSSPVETLASVVFVSALPTATSNPLPTSVPIGLENSWGSGSNPTLNGASIAELTVGSWQCTSDCKCYFFYHCLSTKFSHVMKFETLRFKGVYIVFTCIAHLLCLWLSCLLFELASAPDTKGRRPLSIVSYGICFVFHGCKQMSFIVLLRLAPYLNSRYSIAIMANVDIYTNMGEL